MKNLMNFWMRMKKKLWAITIDADYQGDDESDPNGDMNELFEFTDEIEEVEPLIANAVVAAEIPANAVPAVPAIWTSFFGLNACA